MKVGQTRCVAGEDRKDRVFEWRAIRIGARDLREVCCAHRVGSIRAFFFIRCGLLLTLF